ncbi:MAG: 4Fe-4S binding protein [Candidatus Omnitrophota bacterium]
MKKPGKILREALRYLVRKPVTINYPHQKHEMAEGFRGRLHFTAELCIGCKMCMRDCPSGAIVINKIEDKKFEARIDMGKCIYCAQCVDSCPKKALEYTGHFELAQLKRDKLKVTFHAAPQEKTQK